MDLLWSEVPQPGQLSRPKDNPALHLADSGHSCDPSVSLVNGWAGPLEVVCSWTEFGELPGEDPPPGTTELNP